MSLKVALLLVFMVVFCSASTVSRRKRQLVLCPVNSELRKCTSPDTDIGCEVACPTVEPPKCNPKFCQHARGTRFNGECRCKPGFMRGPFNVCIPAEQCPPAQPTCC